MTQDTSRAHRLVLVLERLTWGQGGNVVGWTPDGRVLYATASLSGLPDRRLVAVDPATGERQRRLPRPPPGEPPAGPGRRAALGRARRDAATPVEALPRLDGASRPADLVLTARGQVFVAPAAPSAGERFVRVTRDGVDPDIVVDNLPHATWKGEDAQLRAAVEHLQKEIARDPRKVPEPPPYPDKSFPRTDHGG